MDKIDLARLISRSILALISSSRSGVGTHFVRSVGRPFFHSCFKKFLTMFEVLRVCQESFKDVSMKFYSCLNERKFQGSFKGVLRKIERCVNVILSGFQVYLNVQVREVSMVFQGNVKGVLRRFQGSFITILFFIAIKSF